jgi:hypothetical protein
MRYVLTILFLSLNTILTATNYYVKNGGNDSNSGLDDAHAWAHHPWMSNWTGKVTLIPGDIVNMNRGNIWSVSDPVVPFMTVRQNGSAGSYIKTTAYGTGNAPIIKIATATNQPVVYASSKSYIIFDNLHIQHHSSSFAVDRSGFLLDNVCHDFIFTKNEISNIPFIAIFGYENCYNIIIGDINSSSTATSAEFSNHIHDFGYAGVGLEGVNPLDGKSHFDVYYNYIHNASRKGSGDNEYGIIFSAQPTSAAWPVFATARYNRVENIDTWEGIECHGGSYLYFLDNYVKNFGSVGIWAGGLEGLGTLPATSDHIYIERNIVEQPASGWIAGKENAFILQYSESNITVPSSIDIKDNSCFYTSRPSSGRFFGIRAGNINGMTISGNQINNGSTLSEKAGIYLTDNYARFGNKNITINRNFISHWGPCIDLEGSTITGSILIMNNILIKPGGDACLKISDSDIYATGKVTISNNVMLSDNYTACFQNSYGIAAGGIVFAKNNILGWEKPAPGYYWKYQGTIAGSFICDNNLYWNSTTSNPFSLKGSNYNWTNWNAQNYDNHSLNNTDPLFLNKSGSFSDSHDFILQSTSPAINKGTGVNDVTNDFFGNPRDATPDIGAYEYYNLVQSVTVTGAGGSNTIATDKGTLQLISTVLPGNAVYKTVTWSIVNSNGRASISSAGLVTAIENGTVMAMATANDGSGASGTLFINIANQANPGNTIPAPVNKPPAVTISSPQKGIIYENSSSVTLEAIASDQDGTIIKVEFFNGSEKLVELISPPYSYIWKNLETGKYSITAVATDNSNATTISLPVELNVSNRYDVNSNILKLYPDPNDGHFSIEFINPLHNERSQIIISDITGKKVYNGSLLKEETSKQFDISNNKSGIYIMMIIDKEILITKKFIKK